MGSGGTRQRQMDIAGGDLCSAVGKNMVMMMKEIKSVKSISMSAKQCQHSSVFPLHRPAAELWCGGLEGILTIYLVPESGPVSGREALEHPDTGTVSQLCGQNNTAWSYLYPGN